MTWLADIAGQTDFQQITQLLNTPTVVLAVWIIYKLKSFDDRLSNIEDWFRIPPRRITKKK